jgi:hypothetical protein
MEDIYIYILYSYMYVCTDMSFAVYGLWLNRLMACNINFYFKLTLWFK